ncbi:MAG: low specificity L-threonine aldolase [Pseudomonadota bacterium]
MNFTSDNATGACEAVLAAIQRANAGPAAGYGDDQWCRQAAAMLDDVFEHEVEVFFVVTGTAANSLALATLVEPWEAIVCQDTSHIANDESTGPEFFTGGARLLPVATAAGKMTADDLEDRIRRTGTLVPHNTRLGAFSLTQSNEVGMVYAADEVAALSEIARGHGMRVHMDGARFANAVAATGASPAELTWKAGVDVLCLGATKCGALAAEAVIFFDPALAEGFIHHRKRAGHLLSKSRLFGAQFVGWLENDEWLRLARHANAAADELRGLLTALDHVHAAWQTESNESFFVVPNDTHTALLDAGARYYDWPPTGFGREAGAGETLIRLVTSFATSADEVQRLAATARQHAGQ